MKKFDEHVARKLGNYVYRLIDPRNYETFYVGQGTGNRIFDHVDEAEKSVSFAEVSPKIRRIREIQSAGLEVEYVIHRHNVPDESLFEVEAAIIDAYPGLTNEQKGHYSNTRGVMCLEEVYLKYNLPKISDNPTEKLILINVNNITDVSSVDAVYQQTRFAWKMKIEKAKQADYVLSVRRGVVIGAFAPMKWMKATYENFPDRITPGKDQIDRIGFIGERAPPDIWEKYVGSHGKLIVLDHMKHVRSPFRYVNIE